MKHISAKVQVLKRSKGRSATKAAAYRAGELITDERTGDVHDYRRKGGVDHSVILAPKGAPDWVQDRSELWNRAEMSETRGNSQVAREFRVAIPCELRDDALPPRPDEDQRRRRRQIDLVQEFAAEHFVAQGMIADVNFHDLDSHNPHAHIQLTMRSLDSEGKQGFSKKKERDWNEQELCEKWRASWADRCRIATGVDYQHLSYERLGIDQIPTIHLGPAAHAMENRKDGDSRPSVKTRLGDINRSIDAANAELAGIADLLRAVEADIKNEQSQALLANKRATGAFSGILSGKQGFGNEGAIPLDERPNRPNKQTSPKLG